MMLDSWFTGDDGPTQNEPGPARPTSPVPPTILAAVADVICGGEPAQAARKILTKLARHIGRLPNPDEIRAVMAHLRTQASELAAVAGTPNDHGVLINAAATAGARAVEARAALKSRKTLMPEDRAKLEAALAASLDAEAVAKARLRAI